MIFNAAIPSDGGGSGKSTYYGTCSTTASTAAKVISGVTGWTPATGDVLYMYCSNGNTAATPTLSINGTAYSIYVGGTSVNATSNVLKCQASTMLEFVYNGTQFQYITSRSRASYNSPDGGGSWYGTSSTAATTATKSVTCDNFRLTPGARISVYFSTANTYSDGAIKLNVNSTGACTIFVHGVATSSTNTLLWEARTLLTFEYDGSYYRFVSSDAGRFERKTSGLGVTFTAESGFTITVAEEFSDGGLYHCKLSVTKTSAWTAWANVKIGSATGLRGAIVCNDALYGSVNSTSNNIWVVPRAAFSANQSVEAEVIGFLA